MATVTVRGEGGHVFEMDVPADGTVKREVFDSHVKKGWLTILSEAIEAEADGTPQELTADGTFDVPDDTIDAVMAWVRGSTEDDPAEGWEDRALEALEAEQAKGDKARKTLVELLDVLIGGSD